MDDRDEMRKLLDNLATKDDFDRWLRILLLAVSAAGIMVAATLLYFTSSPANQIAAFKLSLEALRTTPSEPPRR